MDIQLLLPCASLYVAVITILFTVIPYADSAAYRLHDLMKWLRYLTSAVSMYIFVVLISNWTRVDNGQIYLKVDADVSLNDMGEVVIAFILLIIYFKAAKALYEIEKIGSRLAP